MTDIMYNVKVRVSRNRVEENRREILDVASRLFRARGFGGVSVAEIMQRAGLTHGAFYGYFASKEELAAAALLYARPLLPGGSNASASNLMKCYLSPEHRDTPSEGCVLPIFAPDAFRAGGAVQRAYTAAVRGFIERFADVLPGRAAERRRRSIATITQLVGAIVLARAVDDRVLSDEILAASAAIQLCDGDPAGDAA